MLTRTISIIASCVILANGSDVGSVVECPNQPDLTIKARTASVILLGTIARVENPNQAMPEGPVEVGTTYGGEVKVIFSSREALKGRFHQKVVFDCYQGILELNGCRIPRLAPGKLAAVFLSGKSSPFTLVGGADGIVYLGQND